MTYPLRVRVVVFSDRKHYQLQWTDPTTGRKRTQSSGIENTGRHRDRSAAERKAAELEAKLEKGLVDAAKITWEHFCDRYREEYLSSLAPRTAERVETIFDAISDIVAPRRLRDLTAERISCFQAKLRGQQLAEPTIKTMLAHLVAALRWAKRKKLIAEVPEVDMPQRASGTMKGRPIATEELERMLAKVEAGLLAVNEKKSKKRPPSARPFKPDTLRKLREERAKNAAAAAPSWRHYLRGLWLSGLRLSESLELYWDRDDKLCVDLSGKRPMLRIPANEEKGNKNRLLPMAPEFAEFLLETPPAERSGRVFKLAAVRPGQGHPTSQHVCRVVAKIGEKAGVKVGASRKGIKFASAHDLRRSFGERWAVRVMPQVLMELMRHESIETTLKFYVGRNAERTADVLWQAHEAAKSSLGGNTFGNSASSSTNTPSPEWPQYPATKGVKNRAAQT